LITGYYRKPTAIPFWWVNSTGNAMLSWEMYV
jgi:hypothetical protein